MVWRVVVAGLLMVAAGCGGRSTIGEEPTCNDTVNLARRSVERDRDMDQLHSDALGLALASICRR